MKFRALSGQNQKTLLTSLLLLPLFWMAVRLLTFRRLHAWLTRSPVRGRRTLSPQEIRAMGSLVNSAAYYVLGPGNCLTRSLYLRWLLQRRGVNSELRIGVRLDQQALEAHAWVEVDGQAVNDAPDVAERFAAFDRPVPAGLFSGR